MGLFSKPSEDKVVEMFNGLSDTEKESVKQKLFGTPVTEETTESEKDSSVVTPVEDTEVDAQTSVEPTGEADETQKTESHDDSKKETFEEMFKRLMEEQKKEMESFKADMEQKFETIAKAKEEKNTEKKPFGLAESNKEHKANAKTKETSQEMIKRLFGGNG